MGLFELIFISVGLAMDAFAVSICKGLNMRRMNNRHAGIIALFFGGFQALMPFFGWILGKQFERYITSIDHRTFYPYNSSAAETYCCHSCDGRK